jgi:hypothetical protein
MFILYVLVLIPDHSKPKKALTINASAAHHLQSKQ